MNPLVTEPIKYSKFNSLLADIKGKKEKISLFGLTDSQKAHMVYSIYNYTNMCPVIVCTNVSSAKKMIQDLKFYSNQEIIYFPAREVIYYDSETESREIENARVYAITKIIEKKECVIVTTIEALTQKMLPIDCYDNKVVKFNVGNALDLEKCVYTLNELGYSKADVVEAEGQFAVRGGLIDIFPMGGVNPCRIELFGDDIDSIRLFDAETQKSNNNIDSFELSFSKEYCIDIDFINNGIDKLLKFTETSKNTELVKRIEQDMEGIKENGLTRYIYKYYNLFVPSSVTFLDYISDRIIYFDEIMRCEERNKNIIEENNETLKIMIEKNQTHPDFAFSNVPFEKLEIIFNNLFTVYMERINRNRNLHAKRKEYNFSCREVNFFRSTMDVQISEIKKYQEAKKTVIAIFSTSKKVETVKNSFIDNGISVKYVENIDEIDMDDSTYVYMTTGIISSGYIYDEMNFVVLAEEISGVSEKKKSGKASKDFLGQILNSYDDLKVGDFVVHITHGIGVYLGVETVETYGIVKDYIKIQYKDDGVLYVPVTSLEYIKKYICEDGYVPKINKLGSKEWEKTKYKVSSHIKDIAKDLVKLYAKREQEIGYAFSKDTPWQNEFESDFEYELTEDQKRCIEEMKRDMESQKPMDRLLCGDVGYGKTEVAIRGAFKAVMDNKQVAYLVPTTVLCLQQYNVFKHRMEDYGINVEMLSRFKTKKEQTEIIAKLKSGEVDVIVGTHRLLSKDIGFKDLGFLIIDEEHRFGVEHKEIIKKYRNGVDAISMTATPIPRTLHMSMIGIRDVSVILDPPMERIPVHTYVMEYDDEVVKHAIEKELDRDGQVFYLNNRVENIDRITEKVRQLVPRARVAQAHGQMSPNQVEDIMLSYMEHDIDVLVCTTILESGIDVPNANTIIVENADKLGLAQLYQIRGRVGRSNRLAHAYITYKKGRSISEEAEKRLVAIKEYTEFGSGLKVAIRDLEIRGAGNLLGVQQHGHIADIGYEMYSAMLERAINEEKATLKLGEMNAKKEKNYTGLPEEIEQDNLDVKINIDVSACIPDSYIQSGNIKIQMYQKLSDANNEQELRNVVLELIDRFGEMPKETENLVKIIEIRNICRIVGITEIKLKCEHLVILPFNMKIRLTFGSKSDILLCIKTTLLDIVKSRNLIVEEGKI